MNKIISDRLAKWKDEFANLQRINEKVLNEHRGKIINNTETIGKHFEKIEENKRYIASL